MRSTEEPATLRSTPRLIAAAAAADTVLILTFAAIGRDAHSRGEPVAGVLLTAWPFLAGAAAAWLLLRLWHRPLAVWPAGVAVWLGAVGIGMLLARVHGPDCGVAVHHRGAAEPRRFPPRLPPSGRRFAPAAAIPAARLMY